MTKIRFKLAPKPTSTIKLATGQAGFVPVATRWVIERTNAWMERCKSLVKTLNELLTTPGLNSTFVLFDSC